MRQGTASQAAEKLSCAVILSEAKNLLVIQISKMQILCRLRLLRMTVLWEFFSNLFSHAGSRPSAMRLQPLRFVLQRPQKDSPQALKRHRNRVRTARLNRLLKKDSKG